MKTYYTYLKEFVQDCPNKFMIGYDDVWLTNSQILERVESAAYFLRQQGVQKGDLVAVCMSRSAHTTIAMLAPMEISASMAMVVCPGLPIPPLPCWR